jgi:predicted ATPase
VTGTSGSPQGQGIWLEGARIRGDEFSDRAVYPFNVPAFQQRQELRFAESVAFLVGENGSGKSTLIEAIARRCGFHIWAQPKRSHAPLRHEATLARPAAISAGAAWALSEYVDVTLARGSVKGGVFSAESFREWAEFIDDVTDVDPGQARYHGGEKLTLRSRGEGLLAYFRGRYQIPGLYFLDEPEAGESTRTAAPALGIPAARARPVHSRHSFSDHSGGEGSAGVRAGRRAHRRDFLRTDVSLPAVSRLHGRPGPVRIWLNGVT